MFGSSRSHGLQHARRPWPSPSPGVCPSSSPLHGWCHPTISSSVTLFFCLPSFPASGSFPMSQLFTSCGQNIGVLASASVLPMTIQGWFPLGLTGLVLLQSKSLKGLLQYHSLKATALLPLWSNSYNHTWLLENFDLWFRKGRETRELMAFCVEKSMGFLFKKSEALVEYVYSFDCTTPIYRFVNNRFSSREWGTASTQRF